MEFNLTAVQQPLDVNLTEWNSYLAELNISVDVLLTIIIVVGVFGNGTVIFVYGYKIKRIKDGQFFIPYLATADLIGSIFCPLFVLSRTLMPVIYSSDILCKIGKFINSACIFVSAFLLVTIAFQRYAKICKGQGPIERKQKLLLIAFNYFWAILMASPALTSSGVVPVYSPDRNVTGHTCGSLPGLGPFIYDIILGIAIPVCCVGFIIIYILIARKAIRSLNISERLDSGLYRTGSIDTVPKHQNRHTLSATSSVASTTIIYNKDRRFTLTRLQLRNKHIKSKLTLMFMIITMAFVICSLPKYIILMFERFQPGFWQKSRPGIERVLLMFVNYGYLVLFIINPFVYAFHDHSFREYLPKGITRILSKRQQSE